MSKEKKDGKTQMSGGPLTMKQFNSFLDVAFGHKQEAQQAQTVAHDPVAYAYERYRRRLRHDAERKDAPRAVDDLIEMVVTQAKKITEQAKEIERLRREVSGLSYWKR